MYCFSCFGEAHGDFFTRNNLFILNFTLKKKINCNEKLFFKMLYLASGAGAEGNSVPLGGGGPMWDIWESFLCVQLCGAAERQGCLPVQHLQPFPWLLSDLHSSGRWSQSPGDAAGQMSSLVTSLGWEPKGKLGREQRGACGAAE